MLFQRALQTFGPMYKEKISCFAVPLRHIDRGFFDKEKNKNYLFCQKKKKSAALPSFFFSIHPSGNNWGEGIGIGFIKTY